MNLRIIKKGSSRIATVYPFFFAEERVETQPELYMIPEVALAEELTEFPEEEPSEQIEAEPPPPAIDVEQLEKDAFDRGYTQGREEGREEGLKEGLEEGLKKGEEYAAARIEEMTGRYTDTLAEIEVLKDTLRTEVEEEVVRLALAVAKKIVHREIQIDPTIIHTLVRVALERVSGKSAVTVRLSQPDYEYMMRRREDLGRMVGREINFESDSTITQGSCIIQTETGDVDARIEEEFNEVESAFFEGL